MEYMLNIWVPNQTESEGRIWYGSSAKLFTPTTTAPGKGMQILWHQTHCVFRKQFYKRQCRGMRRKTEQSGCQNSSQKHRWGHTPPTSLALEPDCPTLRCNSMLFFLCIYPQRLDKCVTTTKIAPFLNSRPLYTLFLCPYLPSCHCTFPHVTNSSDPEPSKLPRMDKVANIRDPGQAQWAHPLYLPAMHIFSQRPQFGLFLITTNCDISIPVKQLL